MNLSIIKDTTNVVTRVFGRQLLVVEKNSPAILFGVGVVGFVSTVVLASKATLKVDEVLTNTEKDLIQLEERVHVVMGRENDYTVADYKKDQYLVKLKGVINVAKLYTPAVIAGVVTIAALTGSHKILSNRNVALTAAYTAAVNRFDDYRKRVEDEFGKEKADELIRTREIEVEGEKGKKKKIRVDDPALHSPYAMFFDEVTSTQWQKERGYNSMFLHNQQRFANERLKARGHLFLNEVLDALGMERVPAGQLTGWIYDPKNPDHKGNNFVDFGLNPDEHPRAKDFIVGNERSVLLDFNVDGVVYDLIGGHQEHRVMATKDFFRRLNKSDD